ncbi:MAG: hypothetical protein DI556_07855 [Rhodovulum sulfidophilum]|uniref:GAP family protein n=1 Tax=Rhodovulum sulfidophilum TaxID=35806 RepID=A0A2W5PZR7_RHOSU|nr:MAG: hypothetical protein DI556_07855 [Rhodovulum sulfidophilum]
MLGAIGDFLPVAMVLALSPPPVIVVVILLGRVDGPRHGAVFAAGWLAGLALATIPLALAAGEVDTGASFYLGAGLQILLGLGLLAAAFRKWRTRPRPGAELELPGWAAALDRLSLPKAGSLGVVVALANPKHLAFAFAGVSIIAEHGLEGRRALIAALVFIALSSAGVLGALALRYAGGERGARRLEGVKRFMLRNNKVIMMVILAVIGAKMLGDGLAALGG